MSTSTIAGYVGSAAAVVFGAALLWVPPLALAGQSGTVGLAIAFTVGGFAGFGVTVGIPAVRESARREVRAPVRTVTETPINRVGG